MDFYHIFHKIFYFNFKFLYICFIQFLGSISTNDIKNIQTTSYPFTKKIIDNLEVINYNDQVQNLKNVNIICETSYGLQKFSFVPSLNNTFYRYDYVCVKMIMSNCEKNILTTETSCGGAYSQIQSVLYLISQKVYSGENKIISRFQLKATDDSNQNNLCLLRYEYDTCQLESCDISCM